MIKMVITLFLILKSGTQNWIPYKTTEKINSVVLK